MHNSYERGIRSSKTRRRAGKEMYRAFRAKEGMLWKRDRERANAKGDICTDGVFAGLKRE